MQFFKQDLSVRDLSNLRLSWGWKFIEQLAIATIILIGFNSIAWAQRRPIADETLGNERSIVTPDVINGRDGERIDGGARRGENLFHSFREFSVDEGRSAYFSNPSGVRNILSRVTGSNISEILGTLGVLGDANLFFLNPNGIIFGPNARLDIRGSFLASTGDRFAFADGSEFSATNPQSAPLLTVNVTPGLQYGSGSAVLINRGNLAVGQNLALTASDLDLQGQLQAGQDLTLQAENTVQLRDTVAVPFTATSGRNLTIQGNQGIDILALNHPQSGVWSGGNLSLISDGAIAGDARFYSGGNWSTVTLAGTPTSFVSEIDPVIYANGDVLFGNYTGAALKVEATGSIQGGNITITSPDCAAGSSGCVGGIPATDPDFFTLTGSRAVILRSGVASVPGISLPTLGETNFRATLGLSLGIQVGDISTSNGTGGNGGDILFSAAQGDISTGSLNSSSTSGFATSDNGGDISLYTNQGDISTDFLSSYSSSNSTSGFATSGNGGDISLYTNQGDISILGFDADSSSSSTSGFATSGNGGDISLYTNQGDISILGLGSGSSSFSRSSLGSATSGNGGNISLYSNQGSISVNNIGAPASSSSEASASTSGNGGNISIYASQDISMRYLNSSSSSYSPSSISTSGNGGNIFLHSNQGNISTDYFGFDSYAYSSSTSDSAISGNGGNISLYSNQGDIFIGRSAIGSHSNFSIADINSYSHSISTSGSAISGNGGNISLYSNQGDIATQTVTSYSIANSDLGSSGNSGNGGNIYLVANRGNIFAEDTYSSYSSSSAGNVSNGGAITLISGGQITTSNLNSSSPSFVSNTDNGGTGGDIALTANGMIMVSDLNSSSKNRYGGAITLLSSSGDVSLGTIVWGSLIPGQRNGALRVDTPGMVQFTGTLSPNGADTIIGSQFTPRTIQLPGSILTWGGSFSLSVAGDYRLQDTDLITSSRTGNSGQIHIQTPGTLTLERSRLFTSIEPERTGTGGSITLNVGNLVLNDFSVIDTATFGTGDAGNLSIMAANTITLNQSNIVSVTTSNGNAGQIAIQSGGDVALLNRSSISTAARDGSVGRGGDINIGLGSGTLSLIGGSQLQAFTLGSGASGNITIQAPNVTVTEFDTNDGLRSGIFTSSDRPTSGSGGNITVTTPGTLLVTNGGILSAQTLSNATGGNILIAADTVQLLNRGQLITNTEGSGQAGTITLNAARQVVISGNDPGMPETVLPVFTCAVDMASCSTRDNPDVEFSTRIPYVTLEGLRVDGVDTYTVNISTPGTRAVFDIDGGGSATFYQLNQTGLDGIDTELELVNAQGIEIAVNDDAAVLLGGSGSQPDTNRASDSPVPLLLSTGQDAYSRYVFNTPGIYAIRVGKEAGTLSDSPSYYALHVSLEAPAVSGRVVETAPSSGLFARTTENGRAGNIRINTPQLNVSDQAQVSVETAGQGNAGTIEIQPFEQGQTLIISLNNGQISGSTASTGQGGTLLIQAPNAIILQGEGQLSVETRGIGRAGDIKITAPRLTISNGAEVSASTFNTGDGGNLTVNASDSVLLRNQGRLSTESKGSGQAGNLTINTSQLTLDGEAGISASNQSSSGGDINLTIADFLKLTNSSQISASTQSGIGGDITIQELDSLRVLSSLISAESTTGQAGRLNISASDSTLLRGDRSSLSVRSDGSVAGNLRVSTDQLKIYDGASIVVSNTGQGNAGDLTVNARDVFLDRGSITGETVSGEGGNINLNIGESLELDNNSKISASTRSGEGGDITLQGLNTLQVLNSLISAESRTGRAGRLRVNASDSVLLDGRLLNGRGDRSRGGLSVRSREGGRAGTLTVTTNELNVQDRAAIAVSNTGPGNAGRLTVNARDISLDRSRIIGTTEAGEGGDIQLRGLDSLLLSNGSEISASTGTGQGGSLTIRNQDGGDIELNDGSLLAAAAQGNQGTAGSLNVSDVDDLTVEEGSRITVSNAKGVAGNLEINANSVALDNGRLQAIAGAGDDGNINLNVSGRLLRLSNGSQITARARNTATGGNVTLEVPDGFIVANPYGNNDILANADQGNGGQINITTQSIFGLQQRDIESSFSDINASSEFGLDGTIELNTLNINPAQGLAALPENVTPPIQVDQRCAVGTRSAVEERGEFVVTGRGGLPPDADESLGGDAVDVDLVTTAETETASNRSVSLPETGETDEAIVEAQGWVVAQNGDLVLTAAAPTATPDHAQPNAICAP